MNRLCRTPPNVKYWLAIAALMAAAVACDRDKNGPPSVLLHARDTAFQHQGRETACGDTTIARIVRSGYGRNVYVVSCSVMRGDTVKYLFQDSSKQVLAVGRLLRLTSEALGAAVKSTRWKMDSLFGPSAQCPDHGAIAGTRRQYGWDLDSLSIVLWADSLPPIFHVGYELREGELYCDLPIGPPATR